MIKELSKKYVYLGFIPIGMYLVLLPALQYEANAIVGLYNTKRWGQLILFLFLAVVLLFSKPLKNESSQLLAQIPFYARILLPIVLLIGIISSFQSVHLEWALLEISNLCLIFVLTFLVAAVCQRDIGFSAQAIKLIVLLAVGMYLLKFWTGYGLHIFGDYPLWGSDRTKMGLTGFASKRHFNHIQTWTLPILISFIWMERKKAYRIALLLLTSCWGMLVIASAARGTFAAIFISLFVIAFQLKKERHEFFKIVFQVIILSTFFYVVFFILLVDIDSESLVERFSEKGVGGRKEEWLSLLPGILANPLLGYGPMHYSAVYLDNGWGHPHNWLLQFIYEWGIPIGVMMLGIFLHGILSFSKTVFEKVSDYRDIYFWKFKVAIFWSILASFLHAFISGILVTPVSQVWFILIVGMGIALHFKHANTESINKFNKSIVIVLIFVAYSGFGFWTYNHGLNSNNYKESYIEYYDSTYFHPRFWQQGKIGFK